MKILVFSDTHSRPQRMLDVLAKQEQKDACFFLGDGTGDIALVAKAFPQLPLYIAHGNCDPGSIAPYEGMTSLGGVLFFYTHGHNYGVKADCNRLWWAANNHGATVALYGHTHTASYEYRSGIHIFCPGSISMPRYGPPSYGLISIENGVPSFEICTLDT